MLSGFLALILCSYLITHLINSVAIKATRLITELRFFFSLLSPPDIHRGDAEGHGQGLKYVHGST